MKKALTLLILVLFVSCSKNSDSELKSNDFDDINDKENSEETVDLDTCEELDLTETEEEDDLSFDDDFDFPDMDEEQIEEEWIPDLSDWSPVKPKKEEKGIFKIVWLKGTPYEMGFQHGTLLKEELQNGLLNSKYIKDLKWQISLATLAKIDDMARINSYPDIVEECEGMVAAAGDIGWTIELCLIANFGDVIVEWIDTINPFYATLKKPGCSQFIVSNEATSDGRTYHGRLLDWDEVDFLLWYPTIFVRQPSDGLPHVYIGFPGNLSPYSGMNIAKISGASNESDPFDIKQQNSSGRSHVQMLGQALKRFSSLDEINTFILNEKHMSVEQFGFADAVNKRGANFEMTAKAVAKRELKNGAVWLANHFVDPSTKDLDKDPTGESSLKRYKRLEQFLTPESEHSVLGTLNPATMVNILRDRIDPDTMIESPLGTLDDDKSLATNGAIYAIIFDPGNLFFWVAAGKIPVPEEPFVGFSLGELLEISNAKPVKPAVLGEW
ncbi:MAG: C45 family autoproteolytic acyltransferase/hydrolase [bacterium]